MAAKIEISEISEIVAESGLNHAEFVAHQQASEFGQDHVDALLAEIARLSDAGFNA